MYITCHNIENIVSLITITNCLFTTRATTKLKLTIHEQYSKVTVHAGNRKKVY